jgi:hypothetical protein
MVQVGHGPVQQREAGHDLGVGQRTGIAEREGTQT